MGDYPSAGKHHRQPLPEPMAPVSTPEEQPQETALERWVDRLARDLPRIAGERIFERRKELIRAYFNAMIVDLGGASGVLKSDADDIAQTEEP